MWRNGLNFFKGSPYSAYWIRNEKRLDIDWLALGMFTLEIPQNIQNSLICASQFVAVIPVKPLQVHSGGKFALLFCFSQ